MINKINKTLSLINEISNKNKELIKSITDLELKDTYFSKKGNLIKILTNIDEKGTIHYLLFNGIEYRYEHKKIIDFLSEKLDFLNEEDVKVLISNLWKKYLKHKSDLFMKKFNYNGDDLN